MVSCKISWLFGNACRVRTSETTLHYIYVRQTILDTMSITFKIIKKFKKMDVDIVSSDDLHNFACFQTDKSKDIQWEDSYHYLPVIYTGVVPTNYWTN